FLSALAASITGRLPRSTAWAEAIPETNSAAAEATSVSDRGFMAARMGRPLRQGHRAFPEGLTFCHFLISSWLSTFGLSPMPRQLCARIITDAAVGQPCGVLY